MKCIPFTDLFNLVLSCRNDTKEDVFVHQVSARVNVYNPSFKGCEKKERGGCFLNYCSLQKGYYIQPTNNLAPTGTVGACLNVYIETLYWRFT